MEKKGLIEADSHHQLTVLENDKESRLDTFITSKFPLYSRTFLAKLIKDGHVKRNNKVVTKSSTPLMVNDTITIHFPPAPAMHTAPTDKDTLPVSIIHESTHFLILNKPAGLLVHAPSKGHNDPTLVGWLLAHYKEIENVGIIDRPGIVHRLDKDTSGLIVIPRTNYAHGEFGTMFRDRTIHKTYLAIVHGTPDASGTIDAPIGRDPITKTRMSVTSASHTASKMRHATTHYRVLEYFDDAALVEVKPVTGRTHQIRVHLASIGHQIIGDIVYGRKSKMIKRQALHAAELSFSFSDKEYQFKSDLPEDMLELVKQLRLR